MKIKYIMMVALTLLVAACINDNNEPTTPPTPPTPQETVGIPFTATINGVNEAASRSLSEDGNRIVTAWEVNEEVALVYTVGETAYNTTATVTSVDANGSATISASLQSGTVDGTDVTIIYPASAADGTTGQVKADLLATQNGQLTGEGSIAEKYDVRKGEGLLSVGATASLKSSVSLTNQFAIFKLTLKNADGSAAVNTQTLVVSNELNAVLTTVTTSAATDVMYVAIDPANTVLKFSVPGQGYNVFGGLSLDTKYYQSAVKLTTINVGDVIGLNGRCYASQAAATAASTTAVAMVAYVGTASDCTNGLAIALEDAYSYATYGEAAGKVSNWVSNKDYAVKGGGWRLPSVEDWKYMFAGCGGRAYTTDLSDEMAYGYGAFRTKLVGAGGTDVGDKMYWSCTEFAGDTEYAWCFYFTKSEFWKIGKGNSNNVRACLSF